MTVVDWMFEHPYLTTFLGTIFCMTISSVFPRKIYYSSNRPRGKEGELKDDSNKNREA